MSELNRQVGGSHYKDYVIQPVEFCQRNKLNFCESNILKYTCRHHKKGQLDDIRKVIHYACLLAELEYGVTKKELLE